MDLLRFFTGQHAATHARDVYDGLTPGADRWLGDLSDAQLRAVPRPGFNSIVWLLWHMARTEDVAVNLVVAGRAQVGAPSAPTTGTSARPSPSGPWPASPWASSPPSRRRPRARYTTAPSIQQEGDAAWA